MALPGAELLREVRDEARAKVFVETGTHRGDGVQLALDARFEECYSVESSQFAYGWACCRFQGVKNVHLHYGDSRDFLRGLLPPGNVSGTGIYGPCVLWLDAHWCGGNGEVGSDEAQPPPLLEELAILARHRCRTHALLIDDVRNFGSELPSRDEVVAAVVAVNPAYRIRYVDGYDFANDILVATAPREVHA